MAGRHPRQQGAALLIFLILLVTAALTYVVTSLTPEAVEAQRSRKTQEALAQAREALIGYALKYRDEEAAQGRMDRMYGYLPLPDLGSSRNQNSDPNCKDASNNPLEGCDANTPAGIAYDANGILPTVVGRLPWRTLGIAPLRDGSGECLWLIVSSLHGRKQRSTPPPVLPPMNWDTLGQLDIVVANGTAALLSTLATAHDRPVAIVFAPGPPLPGQDRSRSTTDDVSQCGGNYNAASYLDPFNASALAGITNYLAGTNNASGSTGDSNTANDPDVPKGLVVKGKVFSAGGNYLADACQGSGCALAANDFGQPLTGEMLFGAIRKSANFRTDINMMLDRMVSCLRDEIAASSPPVAAYARIAGADTHACYGQGSVPLGYYPHYKEMVFVAVPAGGANVSVDGVAQPNCAGALLFANQRGAGQQRITLADKAAYGNYLEGGNLASFTTNGNSFAGAGLLDRSAAGGQAKEQDIVKCIPSGPSFTPVVSPTLAAQGFGQLTAYDPGTRTLTLGKAGVTTGAGAGAAALYGCSWRPESHALQGGVRIYYRFNILDGGDGYTFALIDGDRNNANVCGAAQQHLGYSGENADTPYINWPKLGIEFDTRAERNAYSEAGNLLSNGRSDPCYRSACGNPTQNLDYDSHVAIVYWGNSSAAAGVTMPRQDDNVHGYPAGATPRQPPQNPVAPPWPTPAVPAIPGGVAPLNRLSDTTQPRDFHVRIEVTPQTTDSVNRSTMYIVQAWVVADSVTAANQIAAMKITTRPMSQLYPSLQPLVQDSPTFYDLQGGLCSAGCGPLETCNSTDGMCYQPALKNIRFGFTTAQSSRDQNIVITNISATWLP